MIINIHKPRREVVSSFGDWRFEITEHVLVDAISHFVIRRARNGRWNQMNATKSLELQQVRIVLNHRIDSYNFGILVFVENIES